MAVTIERASTAHETVKTATSPSGIWESIRSSLFDIRRDPRFGRLELVGFAVYVFVLSFCIPKHESWFDEAQAWLIAKSASLPDLIVHRLHYEGAPALWHLLLWLLIRAGGSFESMHVLAGLIAVAGTLVWLRCAPLPRTLCLLMPFTFFLQYQYAVVARTYVLAPVLCFSLMSLYQNRRSSPIAFSFLAGLLANCSLHMAALSGGLCIMYLSDRSRSHLLTFRRALAPAGIVVGFFALSVATAVPTSDGSSTTANPIVTAIRTSVSAPPNSSTSQLTEAGELTALIADPPQQNRIAQAVWRAMVQPPGTGGTSHHPLLSGRMIRHILVFLTATTAVISTDNLVAFGFLGVLFILLIKARLWTALLPWIFVQACNVLITGEAHHFGLLWIAFLCAMWALLANPEDRRPGPTERVVLFSYGLAIIILQIGWSVHSIAGDIKGPYSGNEETAEYLRTLPSGKRIAGFDDDSVTVNAYLDYSPYVNQRTFYWPYSKSKDPSLFVSQVLAQHPDIVSVKMSSPESPVMDQWVKMVKPGTELVDEQTLHLLIQNHYRETHRFCGHRFYRNSSEAMDCRILFEPDSH